MLEITSSKLLTAEDPGPPLGGVAKRALDIVLSSLALVILAPAMVLLALAVRLYDGGPSLFVHQRIGANGRPFHCYKFRSMRVNAKAELAKVLETDEAVREEWNAKRKLKADPRVTGLGARLRASSLDELPQLFNVLLGDMSLVGPRPIYIEEIPVYGASICQYVKARPGITGLWQIRGRNNLDFSERVKLDCEYISSWSMGRDLLILLKTIPAVLMRRGSY